MIRLYFIKRGFDVQKAERWFRERSIPYQPVDLRKARLGRRELDAIRRSVGLDALIDTDGLAWKECPARYSNDEDRIIDALLENPARLRLPIVRNANDATVGYEPKTWETW